MGFVLSSVTGAATWEQLDQTGLLRRARVKGAGGEGVRFDDIVCGSTSLAFMRTRALRTCTMITAQQTTSLLPQLFLPSLHVQCFTLLTLNTLSLSCIVKVFMSKGPCSRQARTVVHQYVNTEYWLARDNSNARMRRTVSNGAPEHRPFVLATNKTTTPMLAGDRPVAVAPIVQPPSAVDIYDDSCLNGWTMGNIAATASDISRFYAHLAAGRIVTESSLAQMMTWHNLTYNNRSITLPGAAPGTPYGLGLFQLLVRFWIDASVVACGALPFCECGKRGTGPGGATCIFEVNQIPTLETCIRFIWM